MLTDLTQTGRMDQLLTDNDHLPATDACAAAVLRTCRFWHAERAVLHPLFSLAAIEPVVGAALAQREDWRREQLRHLLRRLADQNAPAATFTADDVLATALAVTSFPAYDRLGELAGDPDRAAGLISHLLRGLTT